MKQQVKFTTLRREENTVREQTQAQSGREFGTVEEMLRHDAAQNPVPPGVSGRLQHSLASEPRPEPSFWARLFKRNP